MKYNKQMIIDQLIINLFQMKLILIYYYLKHQYVEAWLKGVRCYVKK